MTEVTLLLRVPADNERGPLYMEHALAAIHQSNSQRLPILLALAKRDGEIGLECVVPIELQATVESQFYAQFPDARIERIACELEPAIASGHRVWTLDLGLFPDIFPIRRHSQFEDAINRISSDPLTGLLAAISPNGSAELQSRMEIRIAPAGESRQRRAEKCLRRLASPAFRAHHGLTRLYLKLALSSYSSLRWLAWLLGPGEAHEGAGSETVLSTSATRSHDREEDLLAASDKLGRLLFKSHMRLIVAGPAKLDRSARGKLREMAGAFGQFSAHRLASFHAHTIRRWRAWPHAQCMGSGYLLSDEELATLWHPPTLAVRTPSMARVESREFEPPVVLPTAENGTDIATLGQTAFRDRCVPFGILPDDRRRHIAVLGKTGMGKSTLFHNLIASDIRAGRGVGLIDPHGDLAEAVLASIPEERLEDVVLFDAGDAAFPVSFNVLDCPDRHRRPLVASGIISALKKIYGDSWGPRLEHILRNALLALLETPGTCLLSLLRLLGESRYRTRLVSRLADPVVKAFWEREFAAMPPRLQAEAIAPIQNKIGQFVSTPLLRHVVGQARGSVDLRKVLNLGRILIVNLSKGRIGDDSSSLLGSLLVTGLQTAAMSRADVAETRRRDFYLFVDEFQNFATDSFAVILSEARKYRLNLAIANQYLAQMDEATADAVFGNVGTMLTFQVGAKDAEILAEQLGGGLLPPDLMALPRHRAYARLLIEGMPSRPFSMRTLPPPLLKDDTAERVSRIKQASRRRYARPVAEVEAEVREIFARR